MAQGLILPTERAADVAFEPGVGRRSRRLGDRLCLTREEVDICLAAYMGHHPDLAALNYEAVDSDHTGCC